MSISRNYSFKEKYNEKIVKKKKKNCNENNLNHFWKFRNALIIIQINQEINLWK